MKTLIIYAHPWEESFNHHILKKIENLLIKNNKQVDIIDLNKDNFNPVLGKDDLKLFSKGLYKDELASSYAERLKNANELIIIFPIWWYGEPAILKGFYDKIFLKGQVYKEVNHSLSGLLSINKATIITTANIDKEIFMHMGNPIENVLANGILKLIGVKNTSWIHCPSVYLEEKRNIFLNEIIDHFNSNLE